MTITGYLQKVVSQRWLHHLLFWAVVFSGIAIINKPGEIHFISTLNLILLCLSLPLPVYFHFFILEKYFNRKKHIIYISLLIVTIPVSAVFFRSLFSPEMRSYNGIIPFIFNVLTLMVVTTGLKFIKINFSQRIENQQNRTRQFQKEMDLMLAKINPDFIKKTLNSIYRLSLNQSRMVSKLLIQFSEMLRYTIDSQKKMEIDLSQELQMLRVFLELESQSDGHEFKLKVHGKTEHKITPMTILTLIEKAINTIIQVSPERVWGTIQVYRRETKIDISIIIDKSSDLILAESHFKGLENFAQSGNAELQHFSIKQTGKEWIIHFRLSSLNPKTYQAHTG